jgi:hypothetical protein
MSTMPYSGELSMADIRRVFGPARSPGTVDYYGNYTPGSLRFPGPPGDINAYRNADNDDLQGTSNMPVHPNGSIEFADFYGKTCPVYGEYVIYSIYEYPAYSYYDQDGNFVDEPSETVIVYPGDPLPTPKSYDRYVQQTDNVYGDVYSFTTGTKVSDPDLHGYNYGWNYDYDPIDQRWQYGPWTNAGDAISVTFSPTDFGDDIVLGFTSDFRPYLPFSTTTDPPYYDFSGAVNYFEFNIVYVYTGIVDTTTYWRYQETVYVSANFVRNVYGVRRLN